MAAIAAVLGLAFAQTTIVSAKPMSDHDKQFCAAIGLMYHNQAKTYDDQIKKGQVLVSQTKEPKMRELIQSTFQDLKKLEDGYNKLGDFMEKEFGKAVTPEQIKFAKDSAGTPLKKLQENSDVCIKLKAFQ